MKTDLFQSCGHCWVSQICWHIECSTFTASSFKFWNSSNGIPLPPLALFIVMLPKAHLTSHSRMNDHTIMIIWVMKIFFVSSVYSCLPFLISSASVRSRPFLSFIVPIFAWNVPLASLIFLKKSFWYFNCYMFKDTYIYGGGERREQERGKDRESLMYIWILMERIHDKKIS